jgi:hypothetical protein
MCVFHASAVQRRGCEVVIKPVKAKQMTLLLDSELEARQWTKDVSAAAAAAAADEPTAAARMLALLHALSAYSSRGCTGELSLDDPPPPPYTFQSSADDDGGGGGEGSAATEVELPDAVTEAEVETDAATEVQATADEQDTTAPAPEVHNTWHEIHLQSDEADVDAPASAPFAVVTNDHVDEEPVEEEPCIDALETVAPAEAAPGGDVDASTVAAGGVKAAAKASTSFVPVDEVLVHTNSTSVDLTDGGTAEAAAEAAAQPLPPAQLQGGDDADGEPLPLSPAAAVLGGAVHSTEKAEAPDAAAADEQTTENAAHEQQGAVEMPQHWCAPGDAAVAVSAAAAATAEVQTAAQVELPDAVTEANPERNVSTEAEVEPDAVTELYYSAGGDASEGSPPQADAAYDDSDAGSEASVESHAVAVLPPCADTPLHRAAGAAPCGFEGAVGSIIADDSARTYPAAVAATSGSMAMGMLAHATADGGEAGGTHVVGGGASDGSGSMLWSGMDVVLTPHFAVFASSSAQNNNPNAAVTTVHGRCSLTVTMEMTVTAGVDAAVGLVSPASSAAASRTASPLSMAEPSSTTDVAEVVVSNHIQPTPALEMESAMSPTEAVAVAMTTPPRASSSAAAGRLVAPRTPPTPKPAQSGSNDVTHAAYVASVTCTPATDLTLLPPPQLTPLSGYAASDEHGVEEQAAEEDELPIPYAAASYAEPTGADVQLQTERPFQPPPPTATIDAGVECAHAAPSAVSSSPFKIADRKHLLATSVRPAQSNAARVHPPPSR